MKPFSQKILFQEHIQARHSELVTKGLLEAVTSRCERAIVTDTVCPLCGIKFTLQTLKKHLGWHLQQIALFTLPRPSESSSKTKSTTMGYSSESLGENLSTKSSFSDVLEAVVAEQIKCICGYKHDDGFLIDCNKCKEWQHGACMGVEKDSVPDVYECPVCTPEAHCLDIETAINVQESFLKSYQTRLSTTPAPSRPATKKTRDILKGDSKLKILELLTPLEPLKRHQDVKLVRHQDAGTWLLGLKSFRRWQDTSHSSEDNGRVFCCYGIPGAGKTVIRY